jgi:archaellum component FlaC
METNPSKPIVQGTTAVQKDKELIEELEKQLGSLKASYDVLLEEYTTTKNQLNQLKQEGKFQNI